MDDRQRPDWSWGPPFWGGDWSPSRVFDDLDQALIPERDVLPRLVGCGAEAEWTHDWIGRTSRFWNPIMEELDTIDSVPGPMSVHWLEMLREWVHSPDRRATLDFLVSAPSDLREHRATALAQLRLYVVTASEDPWPPGSWTSTGTTHFFNGGLLTAATLLDIVEAHAASRPAFVTNGATYGVISSDREAVAIYCPEEQPHRPEGAETVSRGRALARLEAWLHHDDPGPMPQLPMMLGGMVNKTASYGRTEMPPW